MLSWALVGSGCPDISHRPLPGYGAETCSLTVQPLPEDVIEFVGLLESDEMTRVRDHFQLRLESPGLTPPILMAE